MAQERPTPSLDKVFAFIIQQDHAGLGFPTIRQIQQHMGWRSDQSVSDALLNLAAKRRLVCQRVFIRGRVNRKFSLPAPIQPAAREA